MQMSLPPAWSGGTAGGLPQRRSRVQAHKPQPSFLSPYLQLSLDLSLPGQITPNQVPLNKKKSLCQARVDAGKGHGDLPIQGCHHAHCQVAEGIRQSADSDNGPAGRRGRGPAGPVLSAAGSADRCS